MSFCKPIGPLSSKYTQIIEDMISRYSNTYNNYSIVDKFFGKMGGSKITSNMWTNSDFNILKDIYDDICSIVSTKLNLQLYPTSDSYFGKIYAIKYDDPSQHFVWHFDDNSSNEYRVIYTIKQVGDPFSFAFIDSSYNTQYIKQEVGKCLCIRGATTKHSLINPSCETSATRWCVIFTYTTHKNDSRKCIGYIDLFHNVYNHFISFIKKGLNR